MKNIINKFIILMAIVCIAITSSTAQAVQMIANITNQNGSSGDNGPAIDATFGNYISAMVKDANGNIYIADAQKNVVRKITAATGIITTICGKANIPNQTAFSLGTGGWANASLIPYPLGLTIDDNDNLYVSCQANTSGARYICQITPYGAIYVVAGNGNPNFSGNNTSALACGMKPASLVYYKSGSNSYLFYEDKNSNAIRKIDLSNNTVTNFAGNGTSNTPNNAGPATNSGVYDARNICCGNGNLYFRDFGGIYRINISTGLINHVISPSTSLQSTSGLCADNNGNVYTSAYYNNSQNPLILKINLGGSIQKIGGVYVNISSWGVTQFQSNGNDPNTVQYAYVDAFTIDNCGNLFTTNTQNIPANGTTISKINGLNGVEMGTITHPILSKSIKSVTIGISDAEVSASTTNLNGKYFWNPAHPNGGTYKITPTKDNDVSKSNGVNASDVLALQRHILGTADLGNPYKYIAADIDGNGILNGTDVLRIKRLILGTDFTFKNTLTNENRLWAFIDKSKTNLLPTQSPWSPFINTNFGNNNPLKYVNPFININNLTSCNPQGNDFYGLKLGDIAFDWNPALAKGTKPIELYYNTINATEISNGSQITIPIRANNFTSISGLQFSFSFDPTHFEYSAVQDQNLEGIVYNEQNATGENNTGVMSFVWTPADAEPLTLSNGTVLFNLVLTKKKAVKTDDLALTSDLTRTEAINGDLELIPVTKKRCKIIDNTQGAESNYTYNWDILPNYSKMGNLFIKASAPNNKTVTITVKDVQGNTVFSTTRQVWAGDNNIFMSLKSKTVLPNGVYLVSISGLENEESKPFFVGEADEYATDEDIANGDLTGVTTSDISLALQTLQIQLYKKLMVSGNYSSNAALSTFMSNNATGAFNTILEIERLITDGNFSDAETVLNNFAPDNAVQQNYKDYLSWIRILSINSSAPVSATWLEDLIVQCPLTAGFDVFSARDLYNYLAEDNVQFGDVCPVNTSPTARGVKTNNTYTQSKLQLKPINAIKENLGIKISVYPNPTKGNVNIFIPIEDKGVWKIDVQDIYGKLLSTRNTSAFTKSLDLKVSEQRGIYFISFTNTQSNKRFVEKVVVE